MPDDTTDQRDAPIAETTDPTVESSGATDTVPDEIQDAVETAFEQSIGHLIDSREIHWRDGDDHHHIARFTFSYPEIPAVEDDDLLGWLPPYRAREQVTEELMETLPEGVRHEAKNKHTTTLFREKGGGY